MARIMRPSSPGSPVRRAAGKGIICLLPLLSFILELQELRELSFPCPDSLPDSDNSPRVAWYPSLFGWVCLGILLAGWDLVASKLVSLPVPLSLAFYLNQTSLPTHSPCPPSGQRDLFYSVFPHQPLR
ncbi:hypothetical protein HOY80DRAFT_779510 [Tuber brumale]|nr:hypothetical protein HOY80DRAFT_779510 [Tuber brumale]